MKRIHNLLISIQVYLILLLYIYSNRYSVYSKNGENILTAIPLFHWILLILSSVFIVAVLFRSSRNSWYFSFLLGIMYAFLFYVTNLYFIVPYEQTDIWPPNTIEFLLTSGRITPKALSNYTLSYLSYPVSFILEIAIMLVAGIGKISIYTIGLFTFLGIFYIGLILYYYKMERETKFAVLSLATYIIISFYVINDQVVPQTLALAFLPYIYKLTFDFTEGRNPLKFLTLILLLWFALVFTHPFMFLFYVIPIMGVIVYSYITHRKILVKDSTIGILFSVWGFGFIYLFHNLLSPPLRAFIEDIGEQNGETWWIFANFFRKSGALGPIKYTPHPHYELISELVVEAQAWTLRILLIALLAIATYGFISEIKRSIQSRKFVSQLVFDISTIVSSGVLFVLGLITTFLGQRVFQVAFIPFSRYILKENSKKYLKIGLMIIMMIAPVVYTLNILTNLTVGPQLFVEDEHLIVAGYFGNEHLKPHSKVFVTRELYPSEYPTDVTIFSFPTALNWINSPWDYLYYSSKFVHATKYYGILSKYSLAWIGANSLYDNGVVRILAKSP